MTKRAGISWWDPDPAVEQLTDLTVGDLLDRSAQRHPNRDAVVISAFGEWGFNRHWTFRQLQERADALAKGFISLGLEPGARIALWAPNVADWLAVQFAVAKAGLTLVTVNPGYQPAELAHVMNDSASETLIFLPTFRGNSLSSVLSKAKPELRYLRRVFALEGGTDYPTIGDLIASGASISDEDRLERQLSISSQSITQIQYTSGTSGRPKGAQLRHYALVNNAREFSRGWQVNEADRWCNPIPLFHIGGGAMITLGAMWRGACQLPQPWFDITCLLETISDQQATLIQLVPTMILRALQSWDAEPDRYDLTSLRIIGAGGSVVPAPLRREIKSRWGSDLRPAYGLTETGPVITQVRHVEPKDSDFDSVGKPLAETAVRLVDEAGNATATEVPGELQVRGYLVMAGYLNRPGTGVDEDGWFATGDLATMDTDGYVRIIGRTKDMIIRGGENIYPAELEVTLLDYPRLLEAHVVGVPDPQRGEEVCACIRLDGPGDADGVREWLRQRLSREKIPKYVLFFEEFPLTSSGKVPKNVLTQIAARRLGLDTPGLSASTMEAAK